MDASACFGQLTVIASVIDGVRKLNKYGLSTWTNRVFAFTRRLLLKLQFIHGTARGNDTYKNTEAKLPSRPPVIRIPPSPIPIPAAMRLLHLAPVEYIAVPPAVDAARRLATAHLALFPPDELHRALALGRLAREARLYFWRLGSIRRGRAGAV